MLIISAMEILTNRTYASAYVAFAYVNPYVSCKGFIVKPVSEPYLGCLGGVYFDFVIRFRLDNGSITRRCVVKWNN